MNQLSERFLCEHAKKKRKTSGVVLISFEINEIFEREIVDTLNKLGVENLHCTHIDCGNDRHLRITWSLAYIDVSQEAFELTLIQLLMPTACYVKVYFGRRKRIAMLVSDHLHSLNSLLLINAKKPFPIDVRFIASDKLSGEVNSLKRRVRFQFIPTQDNQAAAEKELLMLLYKHKIDTLVLSNYFHPISAKFIQSFRGDIFCLRLSACSSRTNIQSYEDAFIAGETIVASSAYLRSDGEQTIVIDNRVISISSTEKKEGYIKKCKDNEAAVLFRTLRAHCQNRIIVTNEGCLIHPDYRRMARNDKHVCH